MTTSKSYVLGMVLLLWAALPSQAHNGEVALARALRGIVLDGDFGDWPEDLPVYAIDHFIGGEPPTGSGDIRARFRVGYSEAENALFLAVEIEDDQWVVDGKEADGCQVHFEGTHPATASSPQMTSFLLAGNELKNPNKGVQAQVETSVQGRYRRHEWKLTFEPAGEYSLQLRPGRSIGLSLWVGDVDADGHSRLFWGRGQWQWHGRHAGDVVLLKPKEESQPLSGRIVWSAGAGAAGQQVRVQSVQKKDLWVRAVTDVKGDFELMLPVGLYRLQVLGQVVEIAVPAPRPLELVAEAPRGQLLSVGSGTAEPVGPSQWFGQWQRFGIEDGLWPASVRAMLQSRSGALWFGTGFWNGEKCSLIHFDGSRFLHFSAADGLPDGSIQALAEDRHGHIWIGTRKGAVRFDGEEWRFFGSEHGLVSGIVGVTCFAEDSKGRLCLGTSNGVVRFDGESFIPLVPAGGLGGVVWDIVEDDQGQLWFAADGGVTRFDGETFTAYSDPEVFGQEACRIYLDRRGQMLAHTMVGLFRYQQGRWIPMAGPEGWKEGNGAFLEDNRGHLWVARESLWRYDGDQWQRFGLADGLPNRRPLALLADRDGGVWVGGLGAGLARFDPRRARQLTVADGLPGPIVMDVAEDDQGRLWFATSSSGAGFYDGTQIKVLTEAEGLPSNSLGSLGLGQGGQIWFGSWQEGVGRYDGGGFVTFGEAEGLPSNKMGYRCIYKDSRGRMWFAHHEGISLYDGDRWTVFDIDGGGGLNYALAEDHQGRIWAGQWKRVMVFDGETWHVVEADCLGGTVNAIFVDRSGQLWFGMNANGVCRYVPEEGWRAGEPIPEGAWTHFTLADGLSFSWVTSIAQDQRGHMWFGTFGGGIAIYDGQVMQNLTMADGLTHNIVQEVLPGAAGGMMVATEGGITLYDVATAPPEIYIEDVKTSRSLGAVGQVRLPSAQPFVQIDFRGASLRTRPRRLLYRYRLAGYEDQWRQTKDTSVDYRDLPVGTYRFEVLAIDQDLNYSEPARLDVEVFYQPLASSIGIAALGLEDVFSSFYKAYAAAPVGTAVVVNREQRPVEASLGFFVPGVMARPWQKTLTLAAQSSQEVDLHAVFGPAVLGFKTDQSLAAAVSLSFEVGEQTFSIEEKQDLKVYPRGALRWDDIGRAAAFITPTDPRVAAFARQSLVAFEESINAYGLPLANLTRALVLFEALKAHGLRYIPDANSPYAGAVEGRAVVDHIQYPAQLLGSKSGDCDDLTALYASLLENAGVPTALVDYPGHIFLLFDSGVSRQQAYQLPLDRQRYILRGEKLWLPLEITRLDQSFAAAWKQGLDQLARLSPRDRRRSIVPTAEAWEAFPPTAPDFAGTALAPPAQYRERLLAEHNRLVDQAEEYIDETYLDPLKQRPGDTRLRSELGRVYLALKQYDTAIKAAYNHLRSPGGETAATYNHLGIVHYFKGELEQAAFLLQQALKLAPDNAGIQRNLDKVRAELGEVEADPQTASIQLDPVGVKGAETVATGESFYWFE